MTTHQIIAKLKHEFFDENSCSAPGGIPLQGEARAYDLGWRAGNNAAKRECIAALSMGDVGAGLREIQENAP